MNVRAAILPLLLIGLAPASAAQSPPAVARIVNSHLDESLGSLEFRSVDRRVISGGSRVETRQAGRGALLGNFTFDSHPASMRFQIDFDANNYQGELFEFEGNKSTIGFNQPALSRRSALGDFIAQNDVILREGLLGGVLNAGWPLLDLARRQPKIETDGMKVLDGKSQYRLKYRAKTRQGDLNIYLYFDARSFRHTATVYTLSRAQNIGRTITSSSQESDIYLQLDERFDNFQTVGRLTLPTIWTMEYSESANSASFWRYTFNVSHVLRP
jgi:hypothetical protein